MRYQQDEGVAAGFELLRELSVHGLPVAQPEVLGKIPVAPKCTLPLLVLLPLALLQPKAADEQDD